MPKTVALTPRPSASVTATTSDTPGCFRIARSAYFTSEKGTVTFLRGT